MSGKIIHKHLGYRVFGCAFDVYKKIGPFYRETIYQKAMEVALGTAGLRYERQVPVPVEFGGQVIGHGVMDLVVEGKIVLELKAIEQLHPDFVSQVIQYLASSEMELGILLNFGALCKLQYKRVVLTSEAREKHERAREI